MYTKNAPQTTMDTKARNPGRDQKTASIFLPATMKAEARMCHFIELRSHGISRASIYIFIYKYCTLYLAEFGIALR